MTSSADIPAFAAGFPAADEAQWRGLVDKVLKGGKFERLVGKTADGIAIQPLYPRATAEQPRALPQNPGGWRVLTRIDHRDTVAAKAQAKADLADGATGLHLVFAGSAGACGFGLPATAEAIKQVLDGIDPAGIAFELDLPADWQHIPDLLGTLVVESGLNPGSAAITFGLDPIGDLTRSNDTADWSGSGSFAQQIGALSRQGFAGPFCVADGRIIHASGGSEAQELAYFLSAALAYLRALEAGGDTLDAAGEKVAFRVAADADQFMTIAKLRALRRLWARVEDACGLTQSPIHIHAETAWRMMTRRDPNVNLLRATVAVFSAAVGGADSISVLPFTQALGLPDAFARRLARNTQLVLLEEANIARVADPAGGSGGMEGLTDELSRKAWAVFQTIESQGGIAQARVRKALGADIAAVHAARVKTIATRRTPLTGISEFPNIYESVPDFLEPLATGVATGPYAPVRDAQIFETLRGRAESMSKRPKIFLANYGPLSAFNARATFARNLFEAGGIEAIGNDGFDSAKAMAEAFVASGVALACICSSDALYAEAATDCAQALRNAGARMIYLAGRPGEDEQAMREAGIGRFAFAGCDAASLLDEALKIS